MSKKTLETLSAERLQDTRVLVRADLNVPLDDGVVTDDTRLRATLPTLRTLSDAGSRVVLLSHLGRPGGEPDASLSLRPVADRLSGLLGREVRFVETTVGEDVREAVHALEPGDILLLENTRFLAGETEGDPELARELASYGELFVNDAFGTAHRDHASTAGVARAVRAAGGDAVCGHLLRRELDVLGGVFDRPERPFVAILGGAKISGKIDVIDSLLERVDRLLVGGAMANTFFRALGLETGASLVEEGRTETASGVLDRAGDRLLLPVDCVVAGSLDEGATPVAVPRDDVGAGQRIGDIGPRTRDVFGDEIAGARTVVWNGPMGVFEVEAFRAGTLAVAHAVAAVTDSGALSIVGGGDSAAAAEVAEVSDRLTHVSTGGGAFLAFLAGAELPGVAALSDS